MKITRLCSLLVALVAIAGARGGGHTRIASSTRCAACVRDSRGRIQRSRRAVDGFRRTHPCPATGRTRGACPGYVIDHVQALKHGGADNSANMQWQTVAEARQKDRTE